jgi:hypothetical protein
MQKIKFRKKQSPKTKGFQFINRKLQCVAEASWHVTYCIAEVGIFEKRPPGGNAI